MPQNIISNVKIIGSNTPPTSSTLFKGEVAFGKINGKKKIFANTDDVVDDYSESAEIFTQVFVSGGDVELINIIQLPQEDSQITTALIRALYVTNLILPAIAGNYAPVEEITLGLGEAVEISVRNVDGRYFWLISDTMKSI